MGITPHAVRSTKIIGQTTKTEIHLRVDSSQGRCRGGTVLKYALLHNHMTYKLQHLVFHIGLWNDIFIRNIVCIVKHTIEDIVNVELLPFSSATLKQR